jgi:hypothetical protein
MKLTEYARVLLKIEVWREMRGIPEAWTPVVWVNKNRVISPRWWGSTMAEVITHKWQFSSMTAPGDPNLVKWPQESDAAWPSLNAVVNDAVANLGPDPTKGAVFYFSLPLTQPPAEWGPVEKTLEIQGVQFYRAKS